MSGPTRFFDQQNAGHSQRQQRIESRERHTSSTGLILKNLNVPEIEPGPPGWKAGTLPTALR